MSLSFKRIGGFLIGKPGGLDLADENHLLLKVYFPVKLANKRRMFSRGN